MATLKRRDLRLKNRSIARKNKNESNRSARPEPQTFTGSGIPVFGALLMML